MILIAVVDSAGIPMAVGLDALIILLAIRSPEQTVLNVTLAVCGSAAGTLMLYAAARKGGEKFLHKETPDSNRARFHTWFHRYGLLTVFIPAMVPIPMPLKAFVILAGVFGESAVAFVGTVLVGRIIRYGGEAYLAHRLGTGAAQYLKDHRWHLLVFTVVLFGLLYLIARAHDRRRRAS